MIGRILRSMFERCCAAGQAWTLAGDAIMPVAAFRVSAYLPVTGRACGRSYVAAAPSASARRRAGSISSLPPGKSFRGAAISRPAHETNNHEG